MEVPGRVRRGDEVALIAKLAVLTQIKGELLTEAAHALLTGR